MDKRFEMFFLSLRTFDLSSHIEEIWFKLDFTVNIATLSKKKKIDFDRCQKPNG